MRVAAPNERKLYIIVWSIILMVILLVIKDAKLPKFSASGQTPQWRVDMDQVIPTLRKYAKLFEDRESLTTCELIDIGAGYGMHKLCNRRPSSHCWFYSFGIQNDYSFDTDLAVRWGCNGFAADPTVIHPAVLNGSITFHSVGAKMLNPEENKAFSIVTSLPRLMQWLNHSYVDVLKMDCEGCEYSLAKDVVLEDPAFFQKIGQFALEIHTSKMWLGTDEALYSLGKLFMLLEDAGLILQHYAIGGCSPTDEASGCMELLTSTGFPCGKQVSCHNYLFGRP